MATPKERELLNQLIDAAIKVNASSDFVDVTVEVDKSSVDLRISNPEEVGKPNWEWLFYAGSTAYFSSDIFSEDAFIERCQEFIGIVNGFEGYAVSEIA